MGQPGCNTTKPTTMLHEPYQKPYLIVECRGCDCDENCVHEGNIDKQGHWSNGCCEQLERRKK